MGMTVKQLKKALEHYPDDATIEMEIVDEEGNSISYDVDNTYCDEYCEFDESDEPREYVALLNTTAYFEPQD